MTVTKINGFAAPYRSGTFQRQADAEIGRPGILAMDGPVTQSGSTVTIPPFTFIQRGLIVTKNVATTKTAPVMSAPYYLAVTATTPSQQDDLQFSFAKTPRDLSPDDVIVASYDGIDWHQPRQVSVDGVLHDEDQANKDFRRIGPFTGLLTTLVSGNYQNSAGFLVDGTGERQHFLSTASFPAIATDPDFSRVDRIVYRRPADAPNRVGVREFLLGGTYASSPQTAHAVSGVINSGQVRHKTKVLIGSDNAAHLLSSSGYGASFPIVYKKLGSDRTTTLVATTTLVTATDPAFSAAIDQSNNLHLVYVSNNQIYYRKFGPTGTALTSAIRVDSQSTASTAPAVSIDPDNSKVFIVYQSLLGASNNQIFFTTRDLNGSAITAPKNVTANASNCQNPDIFVSADLWVHLVWEDTGTGKVYFRTFDDIGNAIGDPAVSVSTATTRIGYGTLVDNAKSPRVWVTSNRGIFVTFLQDKGGASFGLSVWTITPPAELGQDPVAAAFMQQLLNASESFTDYDLYVDPVFNGIHLILARSSSVDYAKLEGQTVPFTLNLGGTGAASVATARDKFGSMYHVWAEPLTGGYANYQGVSVIHDIGPVTITGTYSAFNVAANQVVIRSNQFSSQTPVIGDRLVVSGSTNGNNSTKFVTAISHVGVFAANDSWLVSLDSNFAAMESPAAGVNGAWAAPTGNQVDGVKSTSELQSLAYRQDALMTDVLLTRIGMPGSIIVGYLIDGKMALDADAFLVHGSSVAVDWEKTTAGSLTIGSGLKILDMVRNLDYAVASDSYAMGEGDALFVMLDPSNTSPTPQVLPTPAVPWAQPIQVLGIIKEGKFNPTTLFSSAGLDQLDAGEDSIIGEDLPITVRGRLGITSDTTYEAYSSTGVVDTNDTYPEAISKLDTQVTALINNHPLEDSFVGDDVTAQPVFTTTVSGLSWSTNNTVKDLSVYVNGRRQDPWSGSGPFLDGQFKKLTTTSFQLNGIVSSRSRVSVRKEGSSYGGPVPPSAGKLWSDQVDSNIVPPDSAFNVGASANRFSNGWFNNVSTNQLTLTSALGNVTFIKMKTNGDGVSLTAGKPVSLATDGKVYTADSDSAVGQKSIGIALQTIAPGGQGPVLLFGPNTPGVLASLGFSPGDEVFVSETGTYINNSSGFTGGDDTISRIGWADCADAMASAIATDLIICYQTISSAP